MKIYADILGWRKEFNVEPMVVRTGIFKCIIPYKLKIAFHLTDTKPINPTQEIITLVFEERDEFGIPIFKYRE